MANPEHLEILKQGVEVWNKWREDNPGVQPDLREADLEGANLIGANIEGAILTGAYLSGAIFTGASLIEAILIGADLIEAILTEADLTWANLARADLREANVEQAYLGETVFADTDLSEAKGLDTCRHYAPSMLDHRTLDKSGDLPVAFLRGCGLSDWQIESAKLLKADLSTSQVTDITYKIAELRSDPAIQFYSCFISYSSKNEDFARRLHDDLQEAGVRCWFAHEDLKIGDKVRHVIDDAIRLHEKLLLILSEFAIGSQWVEDEVEAAYEEEAKRGKTILFPIRLDESVMDTRQAWASKLRRQRHIGDFTAPDKYNAAFQDLLHDLRAGK